jgi:hypothetical protein
MGLFLCRILSKFIIMARIRSVKPEFFKHHDLFLAEKESKMPLRLGFQGLWVVADKEGRFRWQPHQLKLDILPYDELDFEKVLNELQKRKFIGKYKASDGKHYGIIPSFKEHQRITGSEATAESKIPCPTDGYMKEIFGVYIGNIQETPRTTGEGRGEGKGREKEEEKERGTDDSPPDEFLCFDIEKFLKENRGQFEVVCMNAHKDESEVLRVLKKYHLHCQEKEIYPKKPLPLIAGLQKWLINENQFKNGTGKRNTGEKPVPTVHAAGGFGNL